MAQDLPEPILDEASRRAFDIAFDNIRAFHVAQQSEPLSVETMPGVVCRRLTRPISAPAPPTACCTRGGIGYILYPHSLQRLLKSRLHPRRTMRRRIHGKRFDCLPPFRDSAVQGARTDGHVGTMLHFCFTSLGDLLPRI